MAVRANSALRSIPGHVVLGGVFPSGPHRCRIHWRVLARYVPEVSGGALRSDPKPEAIFGLTDPRQVCTKSSFAPKKC